MYRMTLQVEAGRKLMKRADSVCVNLIAEKMNVDDDG